MSKSEYRKMFIDLKKYIKLGCFCDDIGLARTTFSLFLKDDAFNYMISVERLQELYDYIQSYFSLFT